MMLFVHSAGGVCGAIVAIIWVAATQPTTEGATGALLAGSFIGVVVGHVIEELTNKN